MVKLYKGRTLKRTLRFARWIRIFCLILVPISFYISHVIVTQFNHGTNSIKEGT